MMRWTWRGVVYLPISTNHIVVTSYWPNQYMFLSHSWNFLSRRRMIYCSGNDLGNHNFDKRHSYVFCSRHKKLVLIFDCFYLGYTCFHMFSNLYFGYSVNGWDLKSSIRSESFCIIRILIRFIYFFTFIDKYSYMFQIFSKPIFSFFTFHQRTKFEL